MTEPDDAAPDNPRAGDEYACANGLAEDIGDGRIVICCTTTEPMLYGTSDVRWLDMAGADLSLLNTGRAPLLAGHDYDLASLMGVIERSWVDGGAMYSIARMAKGAAATHAHDLIKARILRSVSIGAYVRVAPEPDGSGAIRTTFWRPYEVSLVTLPRNWGARILDGVAPLRVKRALLDKLIAAGAECGSPATWRAWAETAAGPLAQHAGLDAAAFHAALAAAVEAELVRTAADAAARFALHLGIPLLSNGATP